MRSELMILGMRQNMCRERVLAALGSVDGVLDVHLSLHRGIAIIDHEPGCEFDAMIAAVLAEGYVVAPC